VTLRGSVRTWLPPGTWIDIFTSTVYEGDREIELHRELGSIPALLRAGGILPLAAEDDLDATRNPERLEVVVAPGADGEFTLIEDDDTDVARTTLSWDQASGALTIGAADDPQGVLPAERAWTVTVLGVEHEPLAASGPTGEALRWRPARPAPAHAGPRGRAVRDPQRRPVRARGQGDRLAHAAARTSRSARSSPSCTRRASRAS
jgi:hypothetical protein